MSMIIKIFYRNKDKNKNNNKNKSRKKNYLR